MVVEISPAHQGGTARTAKMERREHQGGTAKMAWTDLMPMCLYG